MATVHFFTFNPFSENTYLVYDETKECIIIDPGCYNPNEKSRLVRFIEAQQLKPVRLLNTHCHLDHVFGNAFIAQKYGLELEIHAGELPVLANYLLAAQRWGVPNAEPSPQPSRFLREGEEIAFGNTKLQILFTPGHSPASICFYSQPDAFIIAGDVLFEGSIGRTDLPGGNHAQLITSIKEKLLVLPDNIAVYPGHGNPTTIGQERATNPFLR